MKNIKVVIGANFGDEGKGLMTDYFASRMKTGKSIVVRFNGGAQAGHTVTSPDGSRHIFGHFCSGAFAGLPGYLSEFFVVNPMLFLKELEQLERIGGINTGLFVDKNCMVTTPYDVMVNHIAEISRGRGKHGSCGVGFNETITRCLYDETYRICAGELLDPETLSRKLAAIRNEYMEIRLRQLGIDSVPPPYEELLENDGIEEGFCADAAEMLRYIELTDIGVLSNFDNIIFEGAQGLLLDQSHEYFPHVTRSNTGIKNAAELINKAGLLTQTGLSIRADQSTRACQSTKSGQTSNAGQTSYAGPPSNAGLPIKEDRTNNEGPLEVIYITRAYMTRHGAGPFPTELPEKPYPGIVDMTNVPNPYQDVLRYGLLDVDALDRAIKKDMKFADGLVCDVSLAITCLDQLEERMDFIKGQEHIKAPVNEFLENVFGKLSVDKGYLSYGPTRETIALWKKK